MTDSLVSVFRKGTRFAFTGILVTLAHITFATASIELFQFSQVLANSLAFVLATLMSYFINTKWSFTSRLSGRGFTRFTVVALIGLLIAASISTLAQHLDWPYVYGIALIVCTIPLVSFSLHNFWTYK